MMKQPNGNKEIKSIQKNFDIFNIFNIYLFR